MMARSQDISDVSLVFRSLLIVALVCCGAGCVRNPQVTSIDLSKHRGVFVVAFLEDPSLRTAAETQLVADLGARGIDAFASFEDIASPVASSAERIEAAARARGVAAVVVLNPVNRDASGTLPDRRDSPLHPDLEAYYQHSRETVVRYSAEREVILEVDLFAIGEEGADRFWSGTAWSFEADGAGGAIPGLSEQIADAMAAARARLVGD